MQNEGSDLCGLCGDRSNRTGTLSTSCGIGLRPCELNSKEQPPTTASLQRHVVNFGVSGWILDIHTLSNKPHLPQDRGFNDLGGYRNGHSLRAKTYLPTCACYRKAPHTAGGFSEASEVVGAALHRGLRRGPYFLPDHSLHDMGRFKVDVSKRPPRRTSLTTHKGLRAAELEGWLRVQLKGVSAHSLLPRYGRRPRVGTRGCTLERVYFFEGFSVLKFVLKGRQSGKFQAECLA